MMPLASIPPHSVASPVPAVGLRPLAIGAARFCDSFDVLAPLHWTAAILLAQLFKALEMEECGWTEDGTHLDDMGARNGCRRWRVSRG